jgi:ArsR family transcriptional regulator
MSTHPVNRMFRAFSDRTRLRLLNLLDRREICVGDLVRILKLPQPTASRHLAYLRKAGLVQVRRNGLWSHYSLQRPSTSFHRRLLDCLRCCFVHVPELASDLDRARRLPRQERCCPPRLPANGRS